MAKTSAIPGWQLAVLILTGTVVGVVVVACLYWAQTVFIPVALAVFLSFLLAPLITSLHRQRGGKPGATPGRRGRPDGDHDPGNAEPTDKSAVDPGNRTGNDCGGLRDGGVKEMEGGGQ